MKRFSEFREEKLNESVIIPEDIVKNPYGVGANNGYIESGYVIFNYETVYDRNESIKQIIKKYDIKNKDINTGKNPSGFIYPFYISIHVSKFK